MEYTNLREKVCEANKEISRQKLAILTWGNVSGIDSKNEVMAIKPSGVGYEDLSPEDIVIVSLSSGYVVDGKLKPSSDTKTHLKLYRQFKQIKSVVHTHSHFATVWAQAEREIPCMGTTHADYFFGTIPLTRALRPYEIVDGYEKMTGQVIVERFTKFGINPIYMPGVLVRGHGPFSWGKTIQIAVENAVILEEVAKLAFDSLRLNPDLKPISHALLEKHFQRKHGKDASYGQIS